MYIYRYIFTTLFIGIFYYPVTRVLLQTLAWVQHIQYRHLSEMLKLEIRVLTFI